MGAPNNLKLCRLTDIELHRLNAKHIRGRTGRFAICKSVKCWLTFGSLLPPPLPLVPLLDRRVEKAGALWPKVDGKGLPLM